MTITAVRPSGADVKIQGVSTSGGTVTAVTSDSNLGTYAAGTQDRGFAWLNLANTVTLTGTTRIKSVQLRVQNGQGTAEAAYQTGWVRLRDPVTGATTGHTSMVRQSTTVSQQRGPVVTTGAPAPTGGVPWTQTLLDRVQLEIAWVTSPAGNYLRVHELYADVDVNTRPTVGTPTVTGSTTTTRPTVSWVYSDADNDPQARYQVKVFTAAQYGAAGFSADSSPLGTAWDSGQLFGNVDNVDVAVDLVNGTTYKAYVRAAQDWPGPDDNNAGVWWSAWVASATFAIAVVPPPQPVITATADTSLPGYRMRLTADLGGLNLLDSDTAAFEGGVGFWQAGTNTSVTTSATNPKSGTLALQLTATAGGAVEAFSGGAATSRRVKPGLTYTALASYRGTTARTVQTGIRWYDASGAVISTPMGTGVSDTTTGYTQVSSGGLVAPSNAFSAVVRVTGAALLAAEVLRVDEVQLAEGTSTSWSAGGYAQNGYVLFERSQRISPNIGRGPARNWLHPQIHSAGALTTTTDGFYPRNAVDSITSRTLDRAAPEAPTNATAGMIEWRIRTATSSYLDIGYSDGVATDGQHPYVFPAVPGKDMTFSMWLWASSTITVRLGLYFTDAFNSASSLPFSSPVVLTTTPQKITVAGTPGAGTVYARSLVENNSGTNNVSVFMTQPRFRPTADPDESWPGQTWAFSWETVRTNGTIGTDGEDVTVYDHECPPGRPVIYRATIVGLNSTGQSLAGTPSIPVHVFMDAPSRNLLKDPFQPENAAVVNIAPRFSRTQSTEAAIFRPLGRDQAGIGTADPVQVRDWLGGQDGSYELATLTEVEYYRLQQLLPAARPLLLQWASAFGGGQEYVLIVEDRSSESVVPGVWKVNVKTLQCARPI